MCWIAFLLLLALLAVNVIVLRAGAVDKAKANAALSGVFKRGKA